MLLYGDAVTRSMRLAIEETARRRHLQAEYNRAHGITPETIKKGIPELEYSMAAADYVPLDLVAEREATYEVGGDTDKLIARLEAEMKTAAKGLEFERAAALRDRIRSLRMRELQVGQ